MIAYVFRRRGWMVPALALSIFFACVFAMRALTNAPPGTTAPGQAIAFAASYTLAGAFVYWFGTRSMREAAAALDRPLRAHEHVFDISVRSPFDSFCFIHLRWWAIAFFAISGWATSAAARGG
jgi:hypothetical protein